MGITVYLIAALVFVGALAGAGYKGYRLGGDSVRAEVAVATAKAVADAEARRQSEADQARKLAANLSTALTKQRSLSRDLGNSLAKHIAGLPARPVGCPPERLTDELLVDVNRALQGAGDAPGGKLPDAATTPADANRSKPDGAAKPAGIGR